MERLQLGEFEELVLLVAAIQHGEAYGVSVMEEISHQTSRKLNISSVHTALDRLEKKGYLKSFVGGATSERGGRRKRLFKVTSLGMQAVKMNRNQRNDLYDKIPEVALNLG